MTIRAGQVSPSAPSRRPIAVVAVIVGAVLVLVVCAAVVWLGVRDSRVDLQPENFVGVDGQGGISLLDGAVDVTAATCGVEHACESAWGTDDMVLMKFSSKNEAAIATRSIGANAYRSDWLVANFIGDSVSDRERRDASEVLDGAWQSEVD